MWLRRSVVPAVCLLVAAAAHAQSGDRLNVGAPAPALEIQEWIQGDETAIEPGGVYIIEFWATWCGPCKVSMPHLNELQEKHGDDGLRVIGITTEDPGVVRRWMSEKGKRYHYTIAVDRKRQTDTAWRQKAGLRGIPAAFIVDQQGRIAFIGNPHPRADGPRMDAVLQKVLQGRFDPVLEAKARPMMEAARAARKSGSWRVAKQRYDEVLALDAIMFSDVALARFEMMLVDMKDSQDAYAYARHDLIDGLYARDAKTLRKLAELITTGKRLGRSFRDLDVALAAADRALDLEGDQSPEALATLALVRHHRGDHEEAVALQERACALASGAAKSSCERTLRSYEGAASGS